MTRTDVLDGLRMLRFFNQRAGRELWFDKTEPAQEEDIEHTEKVLTAAIKLIEKDKEDIDFLIKKELVSWEDKN